MNKSNSVFNNIDAYHAAQDADKISLLSQLRSAILQAAPKAVETISYGMPAFKQNKILVYYAAGKNHIGFYPTPKPIVHFAKELTGYKTSKGAIQFPLDKPLPLALIKKIVRFRKEEDSLVAPVIKKTATTNKKPTTNKKETARLSPDIIAYNKALSKADKDIGELLATTISGQLPTAENKIWHAHPVWFLDGNPIVGYSKLKDGVRLLFWSGQSFDEPGLEKEGKFKAAEKRYTNKSEVNTKDLVRWLKKSAKIQWDYKNIVKKKGQLDRLP